MIAALDAAALSWNTTVDLGTALRDTTDRKQVWDVRLLVSRGDETNMAALSCDGIDLAGGAVVVQTSGRRRRSWRVTPYAARGGVLALSATPLGVANGSQRVERWLSLRRRAPAAARDTSQQA